MTETDKEIIWDLEKESLNLTTLQSVLQLIGTTNKTVTINNVDVDTLFTIRYALDNHYNFKGKLDDIFIILRRLEKRIKVKRKKPTLTKGEINDR